MTDAPSREMILFGTEEPPAEIRILTAGPLTAELEAGGLRYIRYGGREAIRAISYVVRDKVWGTYAPEISDLKVEERPDGFTIAYKATCRGEGQSYSYQARIEGRPDGLRFEATGAGDTDFLTNRTGFVVLHGVEGIAGAPVTVEHVDGRTVETEFPEIIMGDCPIRDIRALTHAVAPGLKVRCEMTGDTFEMEDQRNWTDASYKTYVRPLSLPHPYTLKAGEAIDQAVSLEFSGAAPAAAGGSGEVTVTLGAPSGAMPRVGMWTDAADLDAANAHIAALEGLHPAWLTCFIDMSAHDPAAAFAKLPPLAAALGAPLSLEAVVPGDDPEAEMAALAAAARGAGVEFVDVAASLAADMGFVIPGSVFEDMKPFERLMAAARAAFPKARIGGGNFVYFTELNRKPVPAEAIDFVTHGTSALVHAADDRSVTETIECLPYVFASVRAGYGDKPYRVSPAGVGSRTSPFGGGPTPNPDGVRVTMTDRDPRQRGRLGAAWHLAYAARAAAAGVDELTLGAPVGGFGLIDETRGGQANPAFAAMRAVYAASGASRVEVGVSSPRNLQALAIEEDGGVRLYLANLSGEELTVRLETTQGGEVSVRVAEELTGAADGGREKVDGKSPLRVTAYAVLSLRV